MAETTATKREIGDPMEALSHFFILATTQDHSAAKVAACMLLGLYNGYRFQFDLTELRRLGHTSINALAKHLHRQYRNVFDDVKAMERLGLVEKDKSNGDISNVSAMHIRAMDFEPFAFRINDNALPELIEGYRPEAKKPGRPEEEKFDPYRHITEQQHRIALEAAFGLKEEYGYKDLETALIKSYMSVGVKLNHQKAVSLITMLRNKRMIVQENGRKYTFKPDFHY